MGDRALPSFRALLIVHMVLGFPPEGFGLFPMDEKMATGFAEGGGRRGYPTAEIAESAEVLFFVKKSHARATPAAASAAVRITAYGIRG